MEQTERHALFLEVLGRTGLDVQQALMKAGLNEGVLDHLLSTTKRLKELADQLAPIYTTQDDSDYACYFDGDGDLVLMGQTDPLTRAAICFLVEAHAAVTQRTEPCYHPHRDLPADDEDFKLLEPPR